MSPVKRLLPIIAFLVTFGTASQNQAQAQVSVPLYTTTHCVQVQWFFWRSGGTYWSTQYESEDLADAELVFELFESALESEMLCEILGCNVSTWIPIDVRLKSNTEWNLFPVTVANASDTRPFQKSVLSRE
ncbi:hypothetical protein U8335_01925 [Roseiconus lacunae]|uniref:hypothetical protein n=1 Tax=Roseiconus lacunae TaxID=2605694 RepID=UPI003089C187|nr:hypothetical protein U8335_01925 [Stieleria sp. HD01]